MNSTVCPNCGSFDTHPSYYQCDFIEDPVHTEYRDCHECDIIWNVRADSVRDHYELQQLAMQTMLDVEQHT